MQSDRELIEAVRGGDRASFSTLVRRYERLAASTAWRILREYHSVQDATQNAFVEAFRQLDHLRRPDHFARCFAERDQLSIAQADVDQALAERRAGDIRQRFAGD